MRARVEERTPFPWAVKEPLLKETGGRCAHCGTPLDRYTNLSVDHFIPLSKGGTNGPENLTVLCDDCNSLKADMVLPAVEWYPYLAAPRKKALQERLRRYMRETDYLAEDCLMPLDTFRIEAPVTIRKNFGNGGYKLIRMPVYIQGMKMTNDDAFAWLMEYRRHLLWRDAEGTVKHPSEFMAPYYMMKKGDIEVAMANPWMIHQWDEALGNYRNEIIMDWFYGQELPKRDYLPEMLAYTTGGLENYIARSIAGTMEGACAVLFRTRCFLSDRFCGPVFDILAKGRSDDVTEFKTGKHMTARIRELGVFHILGEKKACKELQKKLDEKSPDGMMSLQEAMQENDGFNKRFEKKEDEA